MRLALALAEEDPQGKAEAGGEDPMRAAGAVIEISVGPLNNAMPVYLSLRQEVLRSGRKSAGFRK